MKRLTVYALVALAVIVVMFNSVAVLFFIAQTVLVTFDRDLGVPHDYPNSEWVSEDGIPIFEDDSLVTFYRVDNTPQTE